jgi:hypothetical protein
MSVEKSIVLVVPRGVSSSSLAPKCAPLMYDCPSDHDMLSSLARDACGRIIMIVYLFVCVCRMHLYHALVCIALLPCFTSHLIIFITSSLI